MHRSNESAANGFGLLANGSSRLWEVMIDESLHREDEWSMELEGPNVYLVFQLRDLRVVPEVIEFLHARCRTPAAPGRRTRSARNEMLTLGRFGTASVSLVGDNEESARCFLLIGPRARSTLRLSLHREDCRMLLEAFRQVAEDLPKKR
jgi:hypothetical protein